MNTFVTQFYKNAFCMYNSEDMNLKLYCDNINVNYKILYSLNTAIRGVHRKNFWEMYLKIIN